MELRHLRYFIAVAEEGSFTLAAERRLHTAQPSLSRQIRDLEAEVGVKLITRSAHGIVLTEPGKVFLDHARLAILQVEAAGHAARRAALPAKPTFVLGFLTGQEIVWLPETIRALRDDLPNVEMRVLSQTSPELTDAILRGTVDAAFIRREDQARGLAFKLLIKEPLIVILSRDHRLAKCAEVRPQDLIGETFIRPSKVAPALNAAIDAFAEEVGIDLSRHHEVENLAMGVSLVASTSGVGLVPIYVQHLLPPTVVVRPLKGAPTLDLVIAYSKTNSSPLLKRLLLKADEMVARVDATTR